MTTSSCLSFLAHDGKTPQYVATGNKDLTLIKLREAYLASQQRKLEQTTLDGICLQFKHLLRIIGPRKLVPTITRADLQAYVDKRSDEWIDPNVYRRKRREKLAAKPPRKNRKAAPPESDDKARRHPSSATIKKEIISLRTAWNWARRQLNLAELFPGVSLDFAKIEEALPFMNWEEAEARIAAGDDSERIWSCVYLEHDEIEQLLVWVTARPLSPWVYPIFVFAAHTGARRSEIVRALPSDVDLKAPSRHDSGEKTGPEQIHYATCPVDATVEGCPCKMEAAAGKRKDVVLQRQWPADNASGGVQLLPACTTDKQMEGVEGVACFSALFHIGPGEQRR